MDALDEKKLLYLLKKGLFNKKARSIILLSILIPVAIILIINYFRSNAEIPSEKMVKCTNKACGNREIRSFFNLNDVHCSKCNGKMKLAYKCRSCAYEFGYAPSEIQNLDSMSSEEVWKIRQEEARCPNCRSLETDPMLIR